MIFPLLAAGALAVAIGHPLFQRTTLSMPARIAASWTTGTILLTLTVTAAALSRLRITPLLVVAAGALLAVGAYLFRDRDVPPSAPALASSTVASIATVGVCFLIDIWKTVKTPLWSWDHFAIWGMKARHLAVTDGQGLAALHLPAFQPSHPEYPLGLPFLIATLNLGQLPDAATFKLIHLIFAAVLVVVVREAVAQRLGSYAAGDLGAAAILVMPLLWDTEQVGLAEVPLAAFAVTAVLLLKLVGMRAAICTGLVVGFLPWTKQEGIPLAALLLLYAIWLRRRSALPIGVVAVVVALSSRFLPLPEGTSFLVANWWDRAYYRIVYTRYTRVLPLTLAGHLLRWEWFGLWGAFFAAFVAAIGRRRDVALFLVVLAQILLYVLIYYSTFLDPIEHVRSSFVRIMGALAPLALVAIAGAFAPRAETAEGPLR
jgi:hypothetical protein